MLKRAQNFNSRRPPRTELLRQGVTHVLNCARSCCPNHDENFYAPHGMVVLSLDASDTAYASAPVADAKTLRWLHAKVHCFCLVFVPFCTFFGQQR